MKKILLTLLTAGLISLYSNAQITVNSTHIFSIGDKVKIATDSTSALTIGTTGANQTWDYSTLSDDGTDVSSIVNPSTLAGESNFASSTIGMTSPSSSELSIFMSKNSSRLVTDGNYLNINPYFVIPINKTVITFPSTMGTSFTSDTIMENSYSYGQDPDGAGPLSTIYFIKTISTKKETTTIDGWGSITTPMGVFEALRQNTIAEIFDTMYVSYFANGNFMQYMTSQEALAIGVNQNQHFFENEVKWWSNHEDTKIAVLSMRYDGNGNSSIRDVQWLKENLTTTPNTNTGIEINENITAINIYPNPASNIINIESEASIESIKIISIDGRIIKTSTQKSISVSELENGMYWVEIETIKGIQNRKFIKQ